QQQQQEQQEQEEQQQQPMAECSGSAAASVISEPDAETLLVGGAHGAVKRNWPELVGQAGEAAVAAIKSDRPELLHVDSLSDDSMVTMDMREDRVRVFVGQNGQVSRAPKVG
ncbi:unnamed protein product, partial [Polarella glacialis]